MSNNKDNILSNRENSGIGFINKPEDRYSEATIVVLGLGRSGTSLISQILINVGIYMGDSMSSTGEDVKIASLIEKKDIESLSKLISKRNKTFNIWGWKRPSTLNFIEGFSSELRNPIYICLFRDIYAISKRNEISIGRDVIEGMGHSVRSYNKMLNFISNTESPCLLISYEKLVSNKHGFVDALNNILEGDYALTPDMEKSISDERKNYLNESYLNKNENSNVEN